MIEPEQRDGAFSNDAFIFLYYVGMTLQLTEGHSWRDNSLTSNWKNLANQRKIELRLQNLQVFYDFYCNTLYFQMIICIWRIINIFWAKYVFFARIIVMNAFNCCISVN